MWQLDTMQEQVAAYTQMTLREKVIIILQLSINVIPVALTVLQLLKLYVNKM